MKNLLSMNLRAVLPAAALSVLLASCGGTGTDNLTLTGTAATGAAIGNRPITAKCVAGGGSAMTGTDGRFSIEVAGGALPCAVQVTLPDGSTLHALVAGLGKSAVVNVTPISELIVAQLAGNLPVSYFSSFDKTAAAAINAAGLQTAARDVVQILKDGDVDFSAVPDVISAHLIAASTTNLGNGFDQSLDALQTAMKQAGTSMKALTEAVAASSAIVPVSTLAVVPQLPPNLLLKPAAANCSALRSTKYRVVVLQSSQGGTVQQTQVVKVDATKLTVTSSTPGDFDTLTPTGPCSYTNSEGYDHRVSPAGVIIGRTLAKGQVRLIVAFPEQQADLKGVDGDWKNIGQDTDNGNPPFYLKAFQTTLDAAGHLIAVSGCASNTLNNCQPITPVPTVNLSVNPAGGFTLANPVQGWSDIAFFYRAGGGERMGVSLSGAGAVAFWSKKSKNTFPDVATVTETRDFSINNQLIAGTPGDSKATIVGVDPSTKSFTRQQVINFTTMAYRTETLYLNNPVVGYNHRLASAVTASDGTTSNIRESIFLGIRGMGMTVTGFPPPVTTLYISVLKP
jgi:hypothetical protein